MSLRKKGKIYKSVVRPALMYSSETWPITKAQERKLEVAEMKMLRWMCGITRRDRVRNDYTRGSLKVGPLGRKIQESRLRWFGHIERREQKYISRKIERLEVGEGEKEGGPSLDCETE